MVRGGKSSRYGTPMAVETIGDSLQIFPQVMEDSCLFVFHLLLLF